LGSARSPPVCFAGTRGLALGPSSFPVLVPWLFYRQENLPTILSKIFPKLLFFGAGLHPRLAVLFSTFVFAGLEFQKKIPPLGNFSARDTSKTFLYLYGCINFWAYFFSFFTDLFFPPPRLGIVGVSVVFLLNFLARFPPPRDLLWVGLAIWLNLIPGWDRPLDLFYRFRTPSSLGPGLFRFLVLSPTNLLFCPAFYSPTFPSDSSPAID